MIEELIPENIRNVCIIGHNKTGKTTLTEALLYMSGMIEKMGSVEGKDTVSDFDEEEKNRGVSIASAIAYMEYRGIKINIIDTPGLADFVGEVLPALRVTESAIVLVDSEEGIQMETHKIWHYADEYGVSKIVFINKMDKEKASYTRVIDEIGRRYKQAIAPIVMPLGEGEKHKGVINLIKMKAYIPKGREVIEEEIPDEYLEIAEDLREKLIEASAEGDDVVLEKYLEGGEISEEEIISGLKNAIKMDKAVPILCGSSSQLTGLKNLFDFIIEFVPSPAKSEPAIANNTEGKEVKCLPKEDATLCAFVFKTRIDQYVGKINYVRVRSGVIYPESEVYNSTRKEKEKLGHIFFAFGSKLKDAPKLVAGDIGALTKLESTRTGDTITDIKNPLILPPLKLPKPVYFLAVYSPSKGDEDKLASALNKIAEEDPIFEVKYNPETKQLVIGGMGDLHLGILLEKAKHRYKVEYKTEKPKIAYKETITKSADARYRHKKQTGGHGQFGEVAIKIEPLKRGEGFKFIDKIVGGVIPKQFIPGVEKGVKESMQEGILAKYPVIDVQVTLYDGKTHPVDSSELSFKIAGWYAFKKALENASPILLEPIMEVIIYAEKDIVGDIMSDITARRGKVLGMSSENPEDPNSTQIIKAYIPQSELQNYAIELRSMSSGRASFEMNFSHYEPLTGKLAENVIKERKKELQEE